MSLPSFTWTLVSPAVSTASTPGRITPGLDWALDPLTGDLDMAPNMRLTNGVEAVAQSIDMALSLLEGEYPFDTSLGVPWFSEILGNKPDLPRARAIVRKAILTAKGVAAIESLEATFAASTRELSITARVRTTEGALLALGLTS